LTEIAERIRETCLDRTNDGELAAAEAMAREVSLAIPVKDARVSGLKIAPSATTFRKHSSQLCILFSWRLLMQKFNDRSR